MGAEYVYVIYLLNVFLNLDTSRILIKNLTDFRRVFTACSAVGGD